MSAQCRMRNEECGMKMLTVQFEQSRSAQFDVCAWRGGRHSSARSGVTLAEMMIAIVILGLGLLLVATLFPVSWLEARRLAEYTTQLSCQEAADLSMRSLLKVDGATGEDAAMLPGDQIRLGGCDCGAASRQVALWPGSFLVGGKTNDDRRGKTPFSRVHVLSLGNLLYQGPRKFVAENTWDLERDFLGETIRDADNDDVYDYDPMTFQSCGEPVKLADIPSFLHEAVSMNDRLYPPMPVRPKLDLSDLSPDNLRWDDALSQRRFAWGVFYRFDSEYVCRTTEARCPDDGEPTHTYVLPDVGETRLINLYYVTLRRTRPTARFARQDPAVVPHPDPREAKLTVVRALGPEKDLMLPVPWRVQVLLPQALASTRECADKGTNCPTGVPTEITVNDTTNGRIDATTPSWVVGMFERGTVFIDELSGQVYRVQKRRLSDNDTVAHLTLDREMVLEDVNFLACREDDDVPPKLNDFERLRTVWVYPPSVQGDRKAGDPLVFDGGPPVVDISVRSVSISPQ